MFFMHRSLHAIFAIDFFHDLKKKHKPIISETLEGSPPNLTLIILNHIWSQTVLDKQNFFFSYSKPRNMDFFQITECNPYFFRYTINEKKTIDLKHFARLLFNTYITFVTSFISGVFSWASILWVIYQIFAFLFINNIVRI